MKIVSAYSQATSIPGAIEDIKRQFGALVPRMVLFFSSTAFPPETISGEMKAAFPAADVFGCTTAGEIASGRVMKRSIVAMGFSREAIDDVKIEIVDNLSREARVREAFASFEAHYKTPAHAMDFRSFAGIAIFDGMSGAEERVMEKIGDLTNVTFVGGSAGDDMKFARTHVFANGRTYTDAALLALLKPAGGFDIIKTQSFSLLDKKLTATKTDEAHREVIEFDGVPATKAYATALGVPVDKVADYFMHYPFGLMIDGVPYVRSPQQALGGKMRFYCNVHRDTELRLLESTDIVKDTREAVESKKKELGGISGIINFHCILRTLELEQKGMTEAYGQIFAETPTIGFSTYGEAYLGHINQTSTMLVFK